MFLLKAIHWSKNLKNLMFFVSLDGKSIQQLPGKKLRKDYETIGPLRP